MLLYQCYLRLLNDTYLWLFDTTVLRIEETHTNDFNDFHRFSGKKCDHYLESVSRWVTASPNTLMVLCVWIPVWLAASSSAGHSRLCGTYSIAWISHPIDTHSSTQPLTRRDNSITNPFLFTHLDWIHTDSDMRLRTRRHLTCVTCKLCVPCLQGLSWTVSYSLLTLRNI